MAAPVKRRTWCAPATVCCLVGAGWLAPPSLSANAEFAAFLVRPATLPFAWHAYQAALERGDPAETFARAQRILELLPTWTDGHAAFAYRFALSRVDSAGDQAVPASERAHASQRRLAAAMAWLESARAHAGRRENELLQALAFLPDVAVRQEPALAALLPRR